jgi:hypothetical protein
MDRSTRHLSANLGRDLLVILAYTAISIAFTYPLVRVFTTHVPGGGDVWQHLWNWWWLKKSLLELGTSPFFTPYLFHPDGTKLAYHSLSVLYKLVGMPLHLMCGIIVSYNLFFLLSYVLGGYGAYRLGLYVTRDRRAAFLSGLLFAFCSFHVYNHSLQVNNFEWLPFAALLYLRTLDEGKIRYGLLAGLCLAFASLCSWYFTVFLLIFLLLALVLRPTLYQKKIGLRPLAGIGLSLVVASLLIAPSIYPLAKEFLSGERYMELNVSGAFSADLVAFITIGKHHPLLGSLVEPLYQRFRTHGSEDVAYLGVTALFLSLLSLFIKDKREVLFWFAVATVFLLLSCGPHPQIMGTIYESISLPHYYLERIPGIAIMRAPIRFMAMTSLAFAVLAGMGAAFLLAKCKNQGRKALFIFVLLCSAALFESRIGRVFPVSAAVPPSFYNWLKEDPGDYAVLEVPLPHLVHSCPLYYQTIHEKKLVGGYVSRTPPSAKKFLQSIPLTRHLVWKPGGANTGEMRPPGNVEIPQSAKTKLTQEIEKMKAAGVKYVIVHKDSLWQTSIKAYDGWLKEKLGKPAHEDDAVKVYLLAE